MKKETTFLASEGIARRAGVMETRYRTPQGRYVLSEKDIRQIRFQMTPEEYVNGLDARIVTTEEAREILKTCTLGSGGKS